MKIDKTQDIYYANKKSNCNFGAIPLARYETQKDTFVKVYQLEKRDLPFVSRFIHNIKQYFADKKIEDYSRREVMEESFGAAEKILSSPKKIKGKARIFLAVQDSNPCGILIGNVLKESKGHKLAYSSRKNHSRKETELDWLATWNPFSDKKIKGTGKILAGEYFNTLKKDGFRDVYVRSEVPELSFAHDFYKKIGFEALKDNRESIIKSSSNKYLIGDFDNPKEDIIPMIAEPENINKVKHDISEKYNRQKLINSSVSLEFLRVN